MPQATAVINTRIKPEIKKEFERVTSQLGLTSSAAINLWLCHNKWLIFDEK